MKCYSLILALIISSGAFGQRKLANLPEPVSNNAVVGYQSATGYNVYSFAGIGTDKTFSDIHQKTFKYSLEDDTWKQLDDLPSGPPRIAAGASQVKDLIYVIGGYQVFQNDTEKSLKEVHIFDPQTDTFLEDGSDIPVAIDDHVQVVWRDSLIYVISGWSDVTNVTNVQIYNPVSNTWTQGTPVPSSQAYRVFGASGCIIGDTIFYAGGARAVGNFPPSAYLRKGVIDKDDPTQIVWTSEQDDQALGYRMASSTQGRNALWFGGSRTTYNYNGIAYNGSGGVIPQSEIRYHNIDDGTWGNYQNLMPAMMDFRGIAKVSEHEFILAGGMTENQQVTDQTVLITLPTVGLKNNDLIDARIFPNPSDDGQTFIELSGVWDCKLYTIEGQQLLSWVHEDRSRITLPSQNGTYIIHLDNEASSILKRIVR